MKRLREDLTDLQTKTLELTMNAALENNRAFAHPHRSVNGLYVDLVEKFVEVTGEIFQLLGGWKAVKADCG